MGLFYNAPEPPRGRQLGAYMHNHRYAYSLCLAYTHRYIECYTVTAVVTCRYSVHTV